MIFQQLSRTDPDKAFAVYMNNAGASIPQDGVVIMDTATGSDGNKAIQPATALLDLFIGLADVSVASSSSNYFRAQTYGYRATSILFQTNTSHAAGMKWIAVNAQWYASSVGTVGDGKDGILLNLDSIASSTASATISARVFLRAL